MAKVFKATFYVSDYSGEIHDIEQLKDMIEERMGRWVGIHVDAVKESAEFEWEDELKINKIKATTEDFEEYFKEVD
ncbi:hypothetical protein PQE70_gp087 [Bacillus phage vB_BanS_Nate]|uniref:Uncharacterized protein n=1 Tax=Bacillus phage vB_BanS_Nate TaxID=2894788 RepID=A0AAE9CDN7_9CAUD|nr:hypothetical protein PQE70_gp087 [Bacillus phage vB_BanS_Nate]UGO50940.1 hypothetical protein NATE_87 [Bacillus phage vB_BanS_Nate]